MRNIIILMSLTLMTISCSKSKTSSSGVSRFEFLSRSPIFPKIQKEICDSNISFNFSPSYLSAYINGSRDSLYIFQNEYKQESNKIESTPFFESIRSFKEDSNVIFTYDPDSKDANKQGYVATVLKDENFPGQDVEVCPELTHIENNTVENATLMVHYIINKTNNGFVNNGIVLDKVSFKVAPYISTAQRVIGGPFDIPRLQMRGGVKTDNASFNFSTREIVFLPQSEEGINANLFGKVPLWEIPMVASHEFGHHGFSSIMTRHFQKTKEHKVHLCFDNQATETFASPNSNSSRKTDIDEAIRALNEGFADMVSYYSLTDEEASLKDITCMEESRDISFDKFKDGQKKIFSSKVISIMNNKNVIPSPRDCKIPDFQEIHDLGAVFASVADKLMSRTITDKAQKLSILINWLEKLNQEYDSKLASADIKNTFEISYELLAKVLVDKGYESDTAELCTFLGTKFSSMDSTYSWNYLNNCY